MNIFTTISIIMPIFVVTIKNCTIKFILLIIQIICFIIGIYMQSRI